MEKVSSNIESIDFTKIFVRNLFVGVISVIAGLIVVVWLLYNRELKDIESNELQHIKVTEYALESFLDDVASDIKTMNSMQLFREFLLDSKESGELKPLIEDLCVNLIQNKRLYNQIRFIDNSGFEIFRVDNNPGEIKVYPKDQLQYKGDRYYFKEAIKLNSGELYLSPLDLNVENGKVEVPYRSVIRLAIPIFDNHNAKKGIFVVNYSGENLFIKLNEQNLINEGNTYIMNSHNYFLMAPADSLEWGFMFPEKPKYTLCTVFPDDEAVVDTMKKGQFLSKTGLFTIFQVKPFSHDYDQKLFKVFPQDYTWKVMFFVPHEKIRWRALIPWQLLLGVFIFVMVAACVMAYAYAKVTYRKLIFQQELIISERSLQKSNKTKDQFFSILSHDLRNSAGGIDSFLSFINDDFESFSKDDLKEHISDIRSATYQHFGLLNEILNWARIQLEHQKVNPVEINMDELFDNQYKTIQLALEKKNIGFEMVIPEHLRVWADRDMTSAIFRNLINNAMKFTPNGGLIKIVIIDKVEKIEIRVIDTGVGIAKKDAEKLFDLLSSFQRSGTDNEPGSGFGLKLVAEMVAKNKGTIKVESEPGKGSQFIVTLPSVHSIGDDMRTFS